MVLRNRLAEQRPFKGIHSPFYAVCHVKAASMRIGSARPVYNGELFLDALASDRQQDYCPLEIVIVNDGSTDGTVELAATLGQEITGSNSKATAHPPLATQATARGEFIAFHADYLWPPGSLSSG